MDKQLVQNVIDAENHVDALYAQQTKLSFDLQTAEAKLAEARTQLVDAIPQPLRTFSLTAAYRLDDQVALVYANGGVKVTKLQEF